MKLSRKIFVSVLPAIICLTSCSSLRPSAGDNPTGKEGLVMHTQVGQGGFIENTNLVIYPGAKGASDIGETFVSFVTADDTQKIVEFYLKELSEKGWIVNDDWTKNAKPEMQAGCARLIAVRKTEVVKIELKPSPKDPEKTLIVPITSDVDSFLKAHPELK